MSAPVTKVKAVFIGDSGVGKTALFQRLDVGDFSEDHIATIGGSFAKVTTESNGRPIEIGFWDTAGQEKFRNIVPMYFQHALAIIITFDLSARDTFEHVGEWMHLAREKAPSDAKYIIVANKEDLDTQVTYHEIESLASKLGIPYIIQTSAKTGAGVDNLVAQISAFVPEVVVKTPSMPQEKEIKSGGCC